MSSAETLTAYADLESAVVEFRKRFNDGAWQLAEADVVDLTQRHHRLVAQLQSIELGLVRELDTRGVPDSLAACSTRAYLSGSLRISPQLASEQTRMATALAERYPDTAAALTNCGRLPMTVTIFTTPGARAPRRCARARARRRRSRPARVRWC